MTDARERLFAAGSRLFKDVTTGIMSHADLYLRMGKGSGSFTFASDLDCPPAATQNPGEVRVDTKSVPAHTLQATAPARPLVADATRASVRATVTPVDADTVLVAIDPKSPVGTYVGAVLDGAGNRISAFVIYMDGL